METCKRHEGNKILNKNLKERSSFEDMDIHVRFQVVTAASMMTAFSDVAPCSFVVAD
jgi:hypothetical protein